MNKSTRILAATYASCLEQDSGFEMQPCTLHMSFNEIIIVEIILSLPSVCSLFHFTNAVSVTHLVIAIKQLWLTAQISKSAQPTVENHSIYLVRFINYYYLIQVCVSSITFCKDFQLTSEELSVLALGTPIVEIAYKLASLSKKNRVSMSGELHY